MDSSAICKNPHGREVDACWLADEAAVLPWQGGGETMFEDDLMVVGDESDFGLDGWLNQWANNDNIN